MRHLPDPHTPLRDLDPFPLGEEAQEQLARVRTFLFVVNRTEVRAPALLAGYTPEIHREGAHRASVLAGERSFGEWRRGRALQPPRDPELPELVATLDAFVESWQPRALAATKAIANATERAELEALIRLDTTRPSLTAKAREWVKSLEALSRIPQPAYRRTWLALLDQGIEAELEHFYEVFESVKDYIREAPLDDEELGEIHDAREHGSIDVREWLDERRTQLAGHIPEDMLVQLALRASIPPPPLLVAPIHWLAQFRPVS